MPGFLPDTSCMIAAICTWHEHHTPVFEEIDKRLTAREPLFVAGASLVEAYAVLTRLPAPHRLRAEDAVALLDGNFVRQGKVIALDAAAYQHLLRAAPAADVRGGRVYDYVILATALKSGASSLLTLNERDFEPLTPDHLEIVAPR